MKISKMPLCNFANNKLPSYNCVVVLAVALALVAASGCSSEQKPSTAAPETVSNLSVISVERANVPDLLEAIGTVRAGETAQLSAQVMGNVIAVNVREGDRVRRGQVLAVIDDTQLRAGLDRATAAVSGADHEAAAAEADFTLAGSTLKRYEDLFTRKSVSPQEFDEVKARYQAASARREMAASGKVQARAALAQARTMFDYSRIRAPFDGVVTEKRVDPGALAALGTPLLTVESSGRFRLEASVDESSLQFVKTGQTVPVVIDALGSEQFSGKVVQIIPAADPASRSFVVKLELPSKAEFRSGLFGRAYFSRGQRESLLVPRTAVLDRGQLQAVYVVGNDKIANLRYVTLGKSVGERVEVLSGVQPGENLITEPGAQELGGKRIEVR